jgi:hypothetical protein
MKIKELKEILNKYDENLDILIKAVSVDGNVLTNLDDVYIDKYQSDDYLFIYGDEDNL